MRLAQPSFQSFSSPLRTKVLGAMAAVAAAMAREAPLRPKPCAKASTLVLSSHQDARRASPLRHGVPPACPAPVCTSLAPVAHCRTRRT